MNYARSQNLYAMAKTAVDAFESQSVPSNGAASQNLASVSTPELSNLDWSNDDSSMFASWCKFAVWNKAQQNDLVSFVNVTDSHVNGKQHLDSLIADSSNIIKHDKTTTVAIGSVGSSNCIVKRYNARDGYHRLSRAVRKSRAQRCWRMSHVFCDAGLNVARPLLPAMNDVQKQQVVVAIKDAFEKMLKAKISHGDLKASNLIWADGKLFFIDLDGSKQHLTEKSTRRANAKDIKRFKRNWHDQPALLSLFDELV